MQVFKPLKEFKSWPTPMAHAYRLGPVTWWYQFRITVGPDICCRGCAYTVVQTVQRNGVYVDFSYINLMFNLDQIAVILKNGGFLSLATKTPYFYAGVNHT